jgi:hypothetical protein
MKCIRFGNIMMIQTSPGNAGADAIYGADVRHQAEELRRSLAEAEVLALRQFDGH